PTPPPPPTCPLSLHDALPISLIDATPLELPKSLIQMEAQQLVERASADLQARGLKPGQVPLDPAVFEATAKRRVALGLIIGELADRKSTRLNSSHDQISYAVF